MGKIVSCWLMISGLLMVLLLGCSAGGGSTTSVQNVKSYWTAPVIVSANKVTFVVGVYGIHKVTATGNPAPSFSVIGTLPAGVTFNSRTGELSGAPAAGTDGTYYLTFIASNGINPDNSQYNFIFTVSSTRSAPVITNSANANFTINTEGSFAVTVLGSPTPVLTLTGLLPSGLSFNSQTGVLSGTPAGGTVGVYPLAVVANNGVEPNAYQNIILTVNNAMSPPAITSSAAVTFAVNTTGSFGVIATGSPLPSILQTGTLPPGVVYNPQTSQLSGTPDSRSVGSYPLTFTASNGISPDAVQNFILTVSNNQFAPLITTPDHATFYVNSAGNYTVTMSGSPTPQLSLSGALPSGVIFNALTGVFSGTPNSGSGGTYPLVITAKNGVVPNAIQNFTLFVSTGVQPATPTGFSATPRDSQVELSWSAVQGATSYNIYWSTASGVSAVNGAKISVPGTSYTHTGLANGVPLYYVVTAVNGVNESVVSAQQNVTPVANIQSPATILSAQVGSQISATSGSYRHVGEMQKTSFSFMGCNITTVNVSYDLDSNADLPKITSNMKWTGSPANCLPGKTFHLSAKLYNGIGYSYVDLGTGVIYDSGLGWGQGVTTTPGWDKLYCGYGANSSVCADAASAKTIFNSVYTVTDFILW